MNERLLHALQHDDPKIRRRAIVALAKRPDEASQTQLERLAQDESDANLRKLARRALHYRQRQAAPDAIVPGYDPTAEHHLRRAHALADKSHANALRHVHAALNIEPRLSDDTGVLILLRRLTGRALSPLELAEASQREAFFSQQWREAAPVRGLQGRVSVGLLMLLLLVSTLGHVLVDQGGVVDALRDWWRSTTAPTPIRHEMPDPTEDDIIPFMALVPAGEAPETGWPTLVLLHDSGDEADYLYHRFAHRAQEAGILLIAPELGRYDADSPDAIDALLGEVIARYPVWTRGPVLFGFSLGGETLSRYVNEYPQNSAGAIMSGAPFVHPPPRADYPYVLIYGSEDPLLRASTAYDVPFADVAAWDAPLNYIVIEHSGHEVNQQHVTVVMQIFDDALQ